MLNVILKNKIFCPVIKTIENEQLNDEKGSKESNMEIVKSKILL
jgi:hypothetical protein